MKENNLYSILNVPNFSDFDTIKLKYKELVKIHHPDKGGKSDDLDQIIQAYEFFKDSDKKSDFDRNLKYENELYEKAEELYLNELLSNEQNKCIDIEIVKFQCMQCFSNNIIDDIKNKFKQKNVVHIIKCENCSMIYKLLE